MVFSKWFETFLNEKGIRGDDPMTVQGPSGVNHMFYENVIEAIKRAPDHEQRQIKHNLVAIDFGNGDVRHYLRHLAQAIAQ